MLNDKINRLAIHLICGFIPNKSMRKKARRYLSEKLSTVNAKKAYKKHGNKFILIKQNGKHISNPSIIGLHVTFQGRNSTLIIHEPFRCQECCDLILGNNNYVEFGSNASIVNLQVPYKMSDFTELRIGKNFTCVGCRIYLHDEPHNSVVLGNDCMLSFNIIIWPSDGHTVYDAQTREVLNSPKSGIVIGNHVWIGMGVYIMKESSVPDNSIIAASSLYNKKFSTGGGYIRRLACKSCKNRH